MPTAYTFQEFPSSNEKNSTENSADKTLTKKKQLTTEVNIASLKGTEFDHNHQMESYPYFHLNQDSVQNRNNKLAEFQRRQNRTAYYDYDHHTTTNGDHFIPITNDLPNEYGPSDANAMTMVPSSYDHDHDGYATMKRRRNVTMQNEDDHDFPDDSYLAAHPFSKQYQQLEWKRLQRMNAFKMIHFNPVAAAYSPMMVDAGTTRPTTGHQFQIEQQQFLFDSVELNRNGSTIHDTTIASTKSQPSNHTSSSSGVPIRRATTKSGKEGSNATSTTPAAQSPFSWQNIYKSLNRHVRGVNDDHHHNHKTRDQKILQGIRRNGYLSDMDRSNIHVFSRKGSNKESVESYNTEISTMITSSSAQSSSHHRYHFIPGRIFPSSDSSVAGTTTIVPHSSRGDTDDSYSLGQMSHGHGVSNSRNPPQSSPDYSYNCHPFHHFENHQSRLTPRYCEPIMLGVSTDGDHLSSFLQFVRAECCQVFTAGREDVIHRKNSKRIILHQVGIRCVFCVDKPHKVRVTRFSCFPSSSNRIYQSIVMMIREHFSACQCFPPQIRKIYDSIRACAKRRRDVDSKQYWASSAMSLGITETDQGLFYLS